ncbi:MAG: GIY-YIG nuclease family protein [Candidatus Promineofilum sp.]|uniref:GIY-YIG nuclease family protein n=1 Tax=Promineifilum sp. TaxID=2664178 RepID=UPI002411F2BB|nr:GIY-YIG nuclease family protein [Promineifilum sp.]
MPNHISFWGDDSETGAYILWIAVAEDIMVTFGRFRNGSPVAVPAGFYAYVGSAMGRHGSSSLAGRLLRHATRTSHQPPHALRVPMPEALAAAGLGGPDYRLPSAKRLHWHIDYLLDDPAVEIARVLVLRSRVRMENELARSLDAHPGFAPLVPGLGASDAAGETHVFRVRTDLIGWPDVAAVLPISR